MRWNRWDDDEDKDQDEHEDEGEQVVLYGVSDEDGYRERDILDAVDYMDPKALAELVVLAQRKAPPGEQIVREWQDPLALRRFARELVAKRLGAQAAPALRVALDPHRMCQTHICLALALHLIQRDLVTSDVTVAISGRELTRSQTLMFDVVRYLGEHGGLPAARDGAHHARYPFRGQKFGIVTAPDTGQGDVAAEIGPGGRLIVFAMPGPLVNTSSSVEHTLLKKAIGNAVSFDGVTPFDLLAVAVPRSPRMRVLVAKLREAPRVVSAALSIVTVAQAGLVDGLPLLDAKPLTV